MHKLENMEKFFRSDYAWGANSKNNADDIRYAINLLQKMVDDNYLEEALKLFDEKYPDYKYEPEFEKDKDNPKLWTMVDNDTEEQKEFFKKCCKQEDIMRKKDYDEFYKFLREHIEEWWD